MDDPGHLPPPGPVPPPETRLSPARRERAPTGDLRSVERQMIEEALAAARYNKSKAAKALGLTRQQLYLRLRKHDLD